MYVVDRVVIHISFYLESSLCLYHELVLSTFSLKFRDKSFIIKLKIYRIYIIDETYNISQINITITRC